MVCSMLLYDDSINLPEFLKLHMRLEVCDKKIYTEKNISQSYINFIAYISASAKTWEEY